MTWDRKTTPRRIKVILAALHRTQRQLAMILSVHHVTVNRWCKGKSVPDMRAQEQLELLEARFVNKPQPEED